MQSSKCRSRGERGEPCEVSYRMVSYSCRWSVKINLVARRASEGERVRSSAAVCGPQRADSLYWPGIGANYKVCHCTLPWWKPVQRM